MTGQSACRWTAIRCREQEFQRFLGVSGHEAAAARVRELCEVGSRAELDRDAAAQARWNERIRKAYLKYRQHNNHNEDTMTHPNEILLEATKLQLLAAALELQRATSTSAHVLPIPGTERSIAIGTPAEVGPLLGLVPVAQEGAQAAQGEQAAASVGDLTDRQIMEEWDQHYLPDSKNGVPFLTTVVKFARSMMGRTPTVGADVQGDYLAKLNLDEHQISIVRAAKRAMVDGLISAALPYGKCGVISYHLEQMLATLGGRAAGPTSTPAQAAADDVRDQLLDEVADHLEALNDSCGDAAARDQREMNLYEEERMHAIQHCANVVRGLKRASDTGEQT